MKTNRLLITRIFSTVLIVSTVFGWVKIVAAQSVNTSLDAAINGLFTPTQAQQFFEAGRRKLETEINFYNPQQILEIENAEIDKNHQIEPMNRVPQSEADEQ